MHMKPRPENASNFRQLPVSVTAPISSSLAFVSLSTVLLKVSLGGATHSSYGRWVIVGRVSTKTWNDLKPPKTTYNHLQPPQKFQKRPTTTSKTSTATRKLSKTI